MEDTRSFEERKKKRNRATPEQVAVLESFFYATPCPNSKQREELAAQINMPERSVQIWFQNRRAKMRNMQKQSQAGLALAGRIPIPRWRRNSTPYGMNAPMNPNMLHQMMYFKAMQPIPDMLLQVDTLVVGSQIVSSFQVWFHTSEPKIWIKMESGDKRVLVHIPFPCQMEWMEDLEGLEQSPCSGIRLQTQNYQVTLDDLSPCEQTVMDEHGVTMVGGQALHQQFLLMLQGPRRPSALSMTSAMSLSPSMAPMQDRRMSLPYQQLSEMMSSQPTIATQALQQPMFSGSPRNRAMSAPAHHIQNQLQHMYGNDHQVASPGSSPLTFAGNLQVPRDHFQSPETVNFDPLMASLSDITPDITEPDFLSNLI
jgi:hypothetical protein